MKLLAGSFALLFAISNSISARAAIPLQGAWKLTSVSKYANHKGIGGDFVQNKPGEVFSFSANNFTIPAISTWMKCKTRFEKVSDGERKSLLGSLKNQCGSQEIQGNVYDINFLGCPDGLSPVDKPFPRFVVKLSPVKAIAFEDGAVFCLELK